ncbi:SepM family pheromone-processing serine protease [Alteribacter natronophilus]|uniref:SepM family pheromone-processing serine protease n=1 Tax=Alteribacter natronophilus TaxID=2583810 RepID=UPI00110EF5D2|nr:SepM family pheromone-processing serine protease [Alteribacter natronophilus]TMW73107.1 PDZ domain-containing protein [Alteribacter natronophilus]
MSNEKRRTIKGSAFSWGIFLLILVFINFYQLPYYFSIPGDAKVLSEVIEVDEGFEYDGSLSLTTVRMGRSNTVNYVWSLLSTERDLVHESLIRPEGESDEEYHHRQLMMMANSQDTAILVAYRNAGKEAYFENYGVIVTSFVEGMDAEAKLEPGDRITAVNGMETQTAQDLLDELGDARIGDQVELRVERDGDTLEVVLAVDHFPEELDPSGERGGIGIAHPVTDRELIKSPEVTIDTRQIGGPSAGLMFSLEIYNQLTEEDITRGHHIAGTGSLNEDGEVGRIGGVKQKVIAADSAGAAVFFVPNENGVEGSNYEIAMETAQSIGTDMEVAGIDTFDEALTYLENLQ